MGGSLNYDKDYMRLQIRRSKTPEQRALDIAGDFPSCKGLYPDCPEKPSLKEKMCRNCPKTEGLQKDNL